MIVKVKMHICLILFSSLLLVMSTLVKEYTLANLWFQLNGNSLIGFQKFIEELSDLYKIGDNLYKMTIYFLNFNLLFSLGILLMISSFLYFIFSD